VFGIAHRLDGRWDESVAALEDPLRAATSGANREIEGWIRTELAEALLGRGEVDRAEQEAETAVMVARAHHSRCDEVRANLTLARILLRRADAAAPARVEQALGRAQELIDETRARRFQPDVHECRAHLARLRGDHLAAEREIEHARRLFAEMGAIAQVERLAGP
jgi:ATP/maltotriose-dependent transcriptional regulator MalT